MTGFFDGLAIDIGRLWSAACNPLIFFVGLFCLAGELFFLWRIYGRALPALGEAAAGRVLETEDRAQIRRMLDRCERWRSLVQTVTVLFPQMGILGTVSALLLELSAGEGVGAGGENLRFAMTSTLYGLAAAICLKCVDTLLGRGVERVERGFGGGKAR